MLSSHKSVKWVVTAACVILVGTVLCDAKYLILDHQP